MRRWALLLFLIMIPKSYAEIRAQGLYGHTSDFWGKVDLLRTSPKSPSEIQSLLDRSFDAPSEGTANAEITYVTPLDDSFSVLFNQGTLGLAGHSLLGGEARNRILPELRGYAVYGAEARFGLERSFPGFVEDGWFLQARSILGMGEQTLIEGPASDFFGGVPETRSMLFYWGFDLGVGYQFWIHDTLRSRQKLLVKPTFFHSSLTGTSYQFAIQENQQTLRWRWETEWAMSLRNPLGLGTEVSVLTITGQQPIPIPLIPRTWDSIQQIETFPSLASLIGLGSRIRLVTDDFSMDLTGGFFGGYLGGELSATWGGVRFSIGSWGLERTSAFQMRESRIHYITLGGSFEI